MHIEGDLRNHQDQRSILIANGFVGGCVLSMNDFLIPALIGHNDALQTIESQV